MGFESKTLKKLHSFLVAAEATCSKGDFPVVAEEARLTAVPGLATAAAPTLLAAAVPVLLNTASGAAQPLIQQSEMAEHKKTAPLKPTKCLLIGAACNVIDSGWP